MRKLMKWSLLGILNALFLYLFFLPQGNFYRITRITGWSTDSVSVLTAVVCLALFVIMSVSLYKLSRKFFYGEVSAYWSVISWVPFYVLLIVANRWLLPITQAGDNPAPVTGLLLIASWFVFPIYIAVITMFATKKV